VTQDGGEDGHGDERGKGGREDNHAWVTHGHESGDKECLVTNFGEQDHGKRKYEGVEGLYYLALMRVKDLRRGGGGRRLDWWLGAHWLAVLMRWYWMRDIARLLGKILWKLRVVMVRL